MRAFDRQPSLSSGWNERSKQRVDQSPVSAKALGGGGVAETVGKAWV
jgi:hypothetical protein